MLSLATALLIGAGLGFERRLRGAATRMGALALAAALGWLAARDLGSLGAARTSLAFALAAGGAVVALAAYLSIAARPGPAERESARAVAAAVAFGLMLGFGANRLAGLMTLVAIFGLAWRALEIGPRPASVSVGGGACIAGGRRPEEGGHDDEGRQQREEQRQGEELAHP